MLHILFIDGFIKQFDNFRVSLQCTNYYSDTNCFLNH